MKGRVLIIAGSDPSGGAGIQADIKTVTALGGYAATAITSLTVQDTNGVSAVHPVAPDVVAAQIGAVLGDIGADAIKIGMIGDVATAEVIEVALKGAAQDIPVVLDPVLAATSGDTLANGGVAGFIAARLCPLATMITPNLLEAGLLTGHEMNSEDAAVLAARDFIARGAHAALIKGGHGENDTITDILVHGGHIEKFTHARINTTSTHGTGCTLASAIATGLAQGLSLTASTARAIEYVQGAIKNAPGYGGGHGPLNHAHPFTS